MKRIVLTFGLIAGAIVAVMMSITLTLIDRGKLGHSEVIGYTTMVLAFVMVFVGIRSYRETVGGGKITFGKAFQVGILITLICCVVYVVTWEIIYFNFMPDFATKYATHVVDTMRASGASSAALAAKQKEMATFQKLYANPLINVGMTFMEIFPVGLIITLLSAAVLRKKAVPDAPSGATAIA
jgi:hypothetical protein